jgi:hypothetical protein
VFVAIKGWQSVISNQVSPIKFLRNSGLTLTNTGGLSIGECLLDGSAAFPPLQRPIFLRCLKIVEPPLYRGLKRMNAALLPLRTFAMAVPAGNCLRKFEGFRARSASLVVETQTKRKILTYMKTPLRSKVFALPLLCVAVLIAASPLAHARQTNDVNQCENGKRRLFIFEGGNPIDFIVALDKHFRTRLIQILTLPDLLRRTEVPKLQVAADDPREVLSVYNRLQSPTLGQWRYEPEANAQKASGTNMNVLMLVPDKSVVAGKTERMKVKALALAGVPEAKWGMLTRDLDQARAYGEEAAKGASDVFGGSFRIQRDSKVLIVSGSEGYIEMVESLVGAHRMNAEIEAKASLSAKAPEGEK